VENPLHLVGEQIELINVVKSGAFVVQAYEHLCVVAIVVNNHCFNASSVTYYKTIQRLKRTVKGV
jgi:hypothetical protein